MLMYRIGTYTRQVYYIQKRRLGDFTYKKIDVVPRAMKYNATEVPRAKGHCLSTYMADISRIVVKLGTQVVVDPETSQPAITRLRAILEDIAAIRRAGTQVILVSSGAVGLGRQTCGIFGPVDLPLKQACAAVGQSR